MSDEFDELRRYINEIDPPDAPTLANVQGRLGASMAAEAAGAGRRGGPRRPPAVRVVAWGTLFLVLALGVAVLVPALGHGNPKQAGRTPQRVRLTQLVVDDLNVTVASGSYDMTFSNTTTTPTHCPAGGTGPGALPTTTCSGLTSPVSGHGIVDTDPYAMVTVADVGPLGSITLYDNGTDVWEIGGGNYGLVGPGQAGPGAPLSGYAASVEGTLGPVAGALDMQGLAGGTGYLDLEAQEIQGAQPAGTGSVDGVPVTIYKLFESGLQDPDSTGLTPEQISTIQAADAIIKASGFAGKTTWISVDSDGYIREQKTVYTLPNGSTVSGDTILSNFGCAGTVVMPGQQGSSTPPSGCVSPDHASAGSNVSPSTPGAPSPTTSSAPSTTTTVTASALVPSRPTAMAVGPNGNLYIADQTRNQILERLANGTFVVVAGTGQVGFAGDGGPAVDAELNRPGGMAFAADGTLYFADEGNGRVRAIAPSGTITTVVGAGGIPPSSGFVSDGTPALDAGVNPNDVAFGPGRQLYLSTGEQVLRLNGDGTLSVVAGANGPYQGVYGVGGPAAGASADGVDGLAFDAQGNLYFFGFNTKTTFVVPPSGVLTEPSAIQIYPRGDGGLATAPDGAVIAMDELAVVRLSPTAEQTVISFPRLFDGISGFSPNGIAVGPDGTIYVDTFYGNGYTDRTAIVSISANGGSSQVLWEAPTGE